MFEAGTIPEVGLGFLILGDYGKFQVHFLEAPYIFPDPDCSKCIMGKTWPCLGIQNCPYCAQPTADPESVSFPPVTLLCLGKLSCQLDWNPEMILDKEMTGFPFHLILSALTDLQCFKTMYFFCNKSGFILL